jgi:hypothetical protein
METAETCIACHAPLQIGLNICPACKTVQHAVYQPEDEVKHKSATDKLRWVYGVLAIGIVVFLGIELWGHRGGDEGAKGVANACAEVKATGYAGSVKDCIAEMGNPSGKR